jgi:hypothetical protein
MSWYEQQGWLACLAWCCFFAHALTQTVADAHSHSGGANDASIPPAHQEAQLQPIPGIYIGG